MPTISVEITKGHITQFLQGPKTGKFRTREGQVFSFKLDVVQSESLRKTLLESWLPDFSIPVTIGLYRSPSGVMVTHISPVQSTVSMSWSEVAPSLPAEPGPYREAKELYHAGDFATAEQKFLEAIRVNDRKSSAVKDLASMLNERGRCKEAIVLINRFLATKEVDKDERVRFTNLRDNIHSRMARSQETTSSAASAFGDRIRGILTGAAPAEPKPVPHLDPVPVESQQEFLCIVQDKKCFTLKPWTGKEKIQSLELPRSPNFAPDQPWKVVLATFACGPDQRPKPETLAVSPTWLDGAWVVPVSLGDWQETVAATLRLPVAETVYFRDDDILAGPWVCDADGNWVAAHGDFVYEWSWNPAWARLDFPDRTYLLQKPAEREGNFYDFTGAEGLTSWLEQKLAQAGPDFADQFAQLTKFCSQALSSPLDVSRWERVHHVLDLAQRAQIGRSLSSPEPVLSVQPGVERGIDRHPGIGEQIDLATACCRCLLVPSPLHTQAYCNNLQEGCYYFLVTPSVTWLSFRDAWPELEWAWNRAHSNPDHLYVLHIEQADLSLLHHWAKPVLNCAHGLTSNLLGYSELPWPDNLRLHWSLCREPEGFPMPRRLRPAFAAIPLESPLPEEGEIAHSAWWLDPFPSTLSPASFIVQAFGDYAHAVALETALLLERGRSRDWPEPLAHQIRRDFAEQYWSHADGH